MGRIGRSVVIFRGVYGLAGLPPPIVGNYYKESVTIRDSVRGVRFKCVIMIDVRATAYPVSQIIILEKGGCYAWGGGFDQLAFFIVEALGDFNTLKAKLFNPYGPAKLIHRCLHPHWRRGASRVDPGPSGAVRIDAVLVVARDDAGAGDALRAAVEITGGGLGDAAGAGGRCCSAGRISQRN